MHVDKNSVPYVEWNIKRLKMSIATSIKLFGNDKFCQGRIEQLKALEEKLQQLTSNIVTEC